MYANNRGQVRIALKYKGILMYKGIYIYNIGIVVCIQVVEGHRGWAAQRLTVDGCGFILNRKN